MAKVAPDDDEQVHAIEGNLMNAQELPVEVDRDLEAHASPRKDSEVRPQSAKKPSERSESPVVTEHHKVRFQKNMRKIVAKMADELPPAIMELALKMKRETVVTNVLGMLGLTCSAYSSEKLWYRRFDLDEESEEEAIINLLKVISWASSLVNVVFLWRYRYMEEQVIRIKRKRPGKIEDEEKEYQGDWATCCAATISYWFLFDVACCLLQPVPYVNRVEVTIPVGLGFQECKYNMDMFLILLMFGFRVMLIWRFTVAHSRFWLKRSLFVPSFTLVDPWNVSVFYRYYHNAFPVALHLTSVTFFLFSSGYLMYIFERAAIDWALTDVNYADKAGAMSEGTPITLWNCVWLQFVTAGTVGYGQYLVHTFIGRAMAVVTVTVGVAYIGLVVSAVEGMLNLNREEAKMVNAMEDYAHTKDLQDQAATLLQRTWMAGVQAKEAGLQGLDRKHYVENKLIGVIHEWKALRKDFMRFKLNAVDVDVMLEKLHHEAGKSHFKQRIITDAVAHISQHQDALLNRQDKVEQQLRALSSRLSALGTFFEKLS